MHFEPMTIRVHSLDADAAARWDAFVATRPEATFFHHAAWRRVLEESFRHPAHFLYAEQAGEIVGVLPLVHIKSRLFKHGLISLPFCVAGGPIAVSDAAYAALDERAAALMAELGADFLEYRNPARPHPDWTRQTDLYANFERALEPEEDANLKAIPRKQRAVVRKALKAAELDWTIDDGVDRFYRLYALSQRNLGTPVTPKRYFERLQAAFGADCEILTVTERGRPVASVMSFYFRDKVMPYYTGSVPEARRLGANDLMYWRLMRQAVGRGAGRFDFGRSKAGTGPYAFKKNWGFEPAPLVYEFKLRAGMAVPEVNPLNPKYRLFIALWQRLPLPLANLIGPHVVRNLG